MNLNIRKKLIICLILCLTILNNQYSKAEENNNDILKPFELSLIKTDNYPITLEEVLKIAIENNIPLDYEKQQKLVDKYDVVVKYSELLPDISASYSQNRFQGGVQIFGNQSYTVYRTQLQPKMTLNYRLFAGGESIYKILAAKRQLKVTEYSLDNTQNKLLYDVAKAYYGLIGSYKTLDIAEKQIEESKATLNLNQKRLDNGLGTILEVSQSEDQLAKSKRDYIIASKNILLTKQNLNYILNLPLELNLIPTDTDIKKIKLVKEMNIPKFLDIAIENRPDLKQVKEIKRVYLAQRGIAKSKFFPTLDFITYWGGQGPRMSDLQDQKSIGFGVELTLLRGMGVNYLYNYKKSAPLLKQADLNIHEKFRQIEKEVAESVTEAEAAEKEIIVTKTSLKAANDSFKFATERLKAGVGFNIDILNAQTNLTSARINLLKSYITYNIAQLALLKSIGLIDINTIVGKKTINTELIDKNTTKSIEAQK